MALGSINVPGVSIHNLNEVRLIAESAKATADNAALNAANHDMSNIGLSVVNGSLNITFEED